MFLRSLKDDPPLSCHIQRRLSGLVIRENLMRPADDIVLSHDISATLRLTPVFRESDPEVTRVRCFRALLRTLAC